MIKWNGNKSECGQYEVEKGRDYRAFFITSQNERKIKGIIGYGTLQQCKAICEDHKSSGSFYRETH